MNIVVNIVLFQFGWFAVVLSAANHMEFLPVIIVTNIVAIHLFLVEKYRPELILVVICGLIGFVVDSINISYGIFSIVGQEGPVEIAPMWLVSLWMLFAITINHSLGWLKERYLLAALMGFVFGPVAYYGGSKLGAITMPVEFGLNTTIIFSGIIWAFVMPLLLVISRTLNQVKVVRSQRHI